MCHRYLTEMSVDLCSVRTGRENPTLFDESGMTVAISLAYRGEKIPAHWEHNPAI